MAEQIAQALDPGILDETMLRAFVAGDESVWQGVVRENQGWLHALAMRMLGHRQDAEDAVQETFVLAFRRRNQLRDARALRGWLRTILVRNCMRRPPRQAGPDWEEAEGWLAGSAAERPDQMASDRERLERVLAAMEQLGRRARACLVLAVFEGMSGKAIAEELGISHGSVRRYIHDARHKLEPVLENEPLRSMKP